MVCSVCYHDKPVTAFERRGRGVRNTCRQCVGDRRKKRAEENPSIKTNRQIGWRRREYGLHDAQFQKLFSDQKGLCAICGEAMKPPCVDHDHVSGVVRALLCSACNRGLGAFKDSLQRLKRAADYLDKFRYLKS